MFVNIENVDWNTIVYTDQTDLNMDDYVRVRGEMLGSFEGENAFGGAITAPAIQASEVSPAVSAPSVAAALGVGPSILRGFVS